MAKKPVISNTDALIGGGLVAAIAVALIVKKNKEKQAAQPAEAIQEPAQAQPQQPANSTPVAVTLNGNLLLKRGSKGNEVAKLQQLLGITADGVFGAQTEAALKAKKGVIEITLNNYNKTPTVNPNPLAVGNRVMANVKPGVTLYDATKAADGSWYTNNKSVGTASFGNEIGTIKMLSYPSKTRYLVEMKGLFSNTTVFVNASDVKKI